MFFTSKKSRMPRPEEALPGRQVAMRVDAAHFVNGHAITAPFPDGMKTAMFGMDANWGRIMMALGNAPVKFNPAKVDISFGPLKVAKDGAAVEFSEAKALGLLKRKEVEVVIDLKSGKGEANVFTSDFSYDYVRINASYRT